MASKRVASDTNNGRNKKIALGNQSFLDGELMDCNNTEQASFGPAGENEIGIIESIYLENFMCHEKLHFDFGPNVNFIIGRNGSGKSAILIGIILGLGGKAHDTNRWPNVKSFVTTGKSYALIVIKLSNRGTEAFEPAKYGSFIIVERRITSNGSSTYKIKNEMGKTMANKKEELTKILDRFNIQVENPVSILTQDSSRNFLNSTNSQDKYKFFAKATQLEQIKLDYSHAIEILSTGKDILKQKKAILPSLEQEMKSKKKDWLELEVYVRDINNLRKQSLWSLVLANEKIIQVNKQNLEDKKEALSDNEERLTNIQSKIVNCQRNKDKTESVIEGINKKLNELKDSFTQFKKEENKLTQDKLNKELEHRKLINTGRSLQEDIKTVRNYIAKSRNADYRDFTEERRLRQTQIEKIMREKEIVQAKLVTNENHLENLKGSIKHYEETLFSYKEEDRYIHNQYESGSRDLSNLEASRLNSIRKYGRYMPAVLKNIEAAFNKGRFTKKPVGPIGSYVDVNDFSLNLAVESCIGNVLTGFCCNTYNDEKVLLEIFRTTIQDGPKPPIVVSKFLNDVYDVRKHAVRSNDYPSVLNSITISNTVAANCLIDQCGIESVLLVKDGSTARQLMLHNPPINCKKTYTAGGDLIFPKPSFRFYSSTKRKVKFLTSSVEDQINELRNDQGNLQARKDILGVEIQNAQQIYNHNTQERKICEAQLVRTRLQINKLNLKIDEIKNTVDPAPDFPVLDNDLEQLKIKQSILYENLNVSKNELKTTIKKIEETRSKIYEVINQTDEIHTISDTLKEKYQNQIEKIQILQEENEMNKRQRNEYQVQVRNLTKSLNKLQSETQVLERKSLEVCERTYTEKSSDTLKREILELEQHLKMKERFTGRREDVMARYELAKQQLHNVKYQIKKYEEITQELQKSLDIRLVYLKRFRQGIERQIKYLFLTSLSVKGYNGKLLISHKNETLSMLVQPSEDRNQFQGDTRSLSGGERSFSTVCLIISLWDVIESPFRILDEYEIFMDMVNRRLSMEMILAAAKRKPNHQFIFLSPLDMPLTKNHINMKICQMPDTC